MALYEDVTFEVILQRMLDAVPDKFDKREGSVIYDALAPAAIELTNMYIELDIILNESFADTETRDYLIKRAAERGLEPEPATKAVLVGKFTPQGVTIPDGARFSCETLNYKVTEAKESTADADYYYLQCETAGEDGNKFFGQLIPIDYIEGLETAELTEIAIPGEDEEDTEVFRQRYFDSFNSQAYGGNKQDYKEKTNSLDGVGGVKVYPVWNGGGTVKLVIIDSQHNVPSSTLISKVQTAIDPTQNAGEGLGIAPIGHVVTVSGVTGVTINITATITYQTGWDWDAAKPYIQAAVDAYFKELAETWENETSLVVRISQIESRILACTGVLDVTDTKLNNKTSNINLTDVQIPIRGLINGE